MVRRWTGLGIAALLALVLGGCGSSDEQPDAQGTPSEADAACRAEFAELRRTARENGDLVADTPLRELWEREDATVSQLVRSASAGDCRDDFGDAKRRYESLVDLGYGIAGIDMSEQLRLAEASLEEAQTTRYDPPPPRLARAFSELREHAGPAHADLGKAVAAVGDIDLEDETAVADAFDEIEAATARSGDVAACQQALDVIADYDLDEE